MFTPFKFICVFQLNSKTVKLFCDIPSFKINEQNRLEEVLIFLSIFYAIFQSWLIHYIINENILLCLEIIMLKYNLMKSSKDEILNDFKTIVYENDDYTSIMCEFIEVLDQFQ